MQTNAGTRKATVQPLHGETMARNVSVKQKRRRKEKSQVTDVYSILPRDMYIPFPTPILLSVYFATPPGYYFALSTVERGKISIKLAPMNQSRGSNLKDQIFTGIHDEIRKRNLCPFSFV